MLYRYHVFGLTYFTMVSRRDGGGWEIKTIILTEKKTSKTKRIGGGGIVWPEKQGRRIVRRTGMR